MIKHILYIMMILAAMAIGGCGEDSSNDSSPTSSTPAVTTPDGVRLLGLTDGRVLNYLVTDSVTQLFPTYNVDVTTSSLVISVSGADRDWQIRQDSTPVLSMKITTSAALYNGYWPGVSAQDSLIYFSVPPALMMNDFEETSSWEGYCPSFADSTRVFYNAYFGFYFTKTYNGTERLYLPAGEFEAHRFDVQLFNNEHKDNVIITLTEHYATDVGLVQAILRGGALKRTLSLVNVADPDN